MKSHSPACLSSEEVKQLQMMQIFKATQVPLEE